MNKLFVIVEFDDRFDRKYRGFGNVAVTHCVGKGHSSLRIGLKVLIHTVGRNTKYGMAPS